MEDSSEYNLFEYLKYKIITDKYGSIRYYNSDGKLHREDGPAIICPNGYKMWYRNGECFPSQIHIVDS